MFLPVKNYQTVTNYPPRILCWRSPPLSATSGPLRQPLAVANSQSRVSQRFLPREKISLSEKKTIFREIYVAATATTGVTNVYILSEKLSQTEIYPCGSVLHH